MPDKFYKPGSWYRIDDKTGFKVRAEHTQKEWTGFIVRDRSWEARQPQDFVRGVRDDQTVPDPRPRQTNVFLDPLGVPMFFVSVQHGIPCILVQNNDAVNDINVYVASFFAYQLTAAVEGDDYPNSMGPG